MVWLRFLSFFLSVFRSLDEGRCLVTCAKGKYQSGGLCHVCDHTCATCVDAGPANCTSCDTGKEEVQAVCWTDSWQIKRRKLLWLVGAVCHHCVQLVLLDKGITAIYFIVVWSDDLCPVMKHFSPGWQCLHLLDVKDYWLVSWGWESNILTFALNPYE